MTQNNSVFVFVRKTSNDSHGGQIRNHWVLHGKKIELGVSTSFSSHISAIVRLMVDVVVKLVFVLVIVEPDDSPAPTL